MDIVERGIEFIRKCINCFHIICLLCCLSALFKGDGALELASMVFPLALFLVPLDLFIGIQGAMGLANCSDIRVCKIIGSVNKKGRKHRLLLQPIDGSYRNIESKHHVSMRKYPIGGLVNVCFEPCGSAYYIPKIDPMILINYNYYKLLACFIVVIILDLIVL